jgi:hypothetical protein
MAILLAFALLWLTLLAASVRQRKAGLYWATVAGGLLLVGVYGWLSRAIAITKDDRDAGFEAMAVAGSAVLLLSAIAGLWLRARRQR